MITVLVWCFYGLRSDEDDFLTWLVSEPTKEVSLLDLLFTSRELVGDVKVGGRLGCSDHEILQFSGLAAVATGGQ